MKVSVKTPATIANLGPGFDSFGLALPLYNIVSVEETVLPGSGIEINIINEKNNEKSELADVPTDKTNIVYKAIELLYNFIGQVPNELKITIKTQIPISRGLGSSSSVIVGGLIAANELLGRNTGTGESHAYKMISRILKLPPKKQKVVIQTMSALIDGIEGIW